jgi:peptidoglycan/LPS O-acetylase OafA/YrhL
MGEIRIKKVVPALTGIRFFAAAYVFVMHYGATAIDKAGVPRPIATFLHNGGFGVAVFFILSGFILAHSHPGVFATPRQYAEYFVARFARIYPLYFFALIVALPVAVEEIPLDLKQAAAVLAMVQSWTDAFSHSGYAWILQAWTISVELIFYLCFPFLISLQRRLRTPILLGLCAIDAVFIIVGGTTTVTPWTDFDGYIHHPAWSLYLPLPLVRSGEFFLGMGLQTLITRSLPITVKPRAAHCILLSAAIVTLLSIGSDERVLGSAAILIGILIATVYISDNAFTRLLGCRALILLGNASYALYLLQAPIREYLGIFIPAPYGRLLCFPITLLAAILLWRFVEVPARLYLISLHHRAWGRRLFERGPKEGDREALPIKRD